MNYSKKIIKGIWCIGNKKIVLIGGGEHCKVVIDIISLNTDLKIIGITDKLKSPGEYICGIKVLGDDTLLPFLKKEKVDYAFISIGGIGNNLLRKQLYSVAKDFGFAFPVLKHPSAVIAGNVGIGDGTLIGGGVVINSGASIGENCIINTGSIIEHGVVIGDHVHVAPGAIIAGSVKIGDLAHIGMGANIIQNLEVGESSIIGAGAVVIHNVPERVVVVGVPGKILKRL